MTPLEWAGMAAASFAAALLQGTTGFGFAVLATPLFLRFIPAAAAVQLTIIVTLALSAVVLPGLRRTLDRGLLLRLIAGAFLGLPLGMLAFRFANAASVRAAAGATILSFTALLAWRQAVAAPSTARRFTMTPARDVAAGAVSGALTALLGMSGPPVLIYMLLAAVPPQAVRTTLLHFFAVAYAVTLLAHVATVGVPFRTWLTALLLLPPAFIGGLAGRRLNARLGGNVFVWIALVTLAVVGVGTLADAARAIVN